MSNIVTYLASSYLLLYHIYIYIQIKEKEKEVANQVQWEKQNQAIPSMSPFLIPQDLPVLNMRLYIFSSILPFNLNFDLLEVIFIAIAV